MNRTKEHRRELRRARRDVITGLQEEATALGFEPARTTGNFTQYLLASIPSEGWELSDKTLQKHAKIMRGAAVDSFDGDLRGATRWALKAWEQADRFDFSPWAFVGEIANPNHVTPWEQYGGQSL